MITTIFFGVGGVLLSQGWDCGSRREATKVFHLDGDFEDRHERVVDAFERGELSLDAYLGEVVFNRARDFSDAQFRNFIFERQRAISHSLELLGEIADRRRYLLATLSNESLELNEYRIANFGLRAFFSAFFSSCFVGLRKPERSIYELALKVAQRPAGECLFVDDTEANVAAAAVLGLQTIHFASPARLERELRDLGVLS